MLAPKNEKRYLRLLIYKNGMLDKEFVINQRKLMVGTFKYNDIMLDSSHVSHYHAIIFLSDNGEGGRITDLESENGIFINGKSTKEGYFSIGDVLKIGDIELHVDESIEMVNFVDQDKEVLKISNAQNEIYTPELPPVEDLELIDGEYCNIHFNDDHYIAQNVVNIHHHDGFYKSYIDYETTNEKDLINIIRKNPRSSIEVTVLSCGNILSSDFLPIKNQTYYISDRKSNAKTILINSFDFHKSHPFIKITKNSILLNDIPGFSATNVTSGAHDLFSTASNIELNEDDIIYFSNQTNQILIRHVSSPPKLGIVPFFGRDNKFKLHVMKIFSILMALMLLLLFIDLHDEQIPPKKKMSVIFKRAVEKKRPKNVEKKDTPPPKQLSAPKPEKKIVTAKKKTKVKTKVNKKIVKKRKQKKIIKAYKFKMNNSLSSLFSSETVKNVKLTQTTVDNSFNVNKTKNIATLNNKSGVKIGTMGKAFKGKHSNSFGAKGLVSKSGFDTTYMDPKTVVLGSMDPELLRKILKEYLPQFRHCYQEELIDNENIKGVVNLNFTIGRSGKVIKIKIKGKRAKFSKRGVKCMRKVLKIIDFPKPKGGGVVDVRQPLNFFSERGVR